MADWERYVRARPGDLFQWPHDATVSRPFFYNPDAVMIDDKEIAEICSVKANTNMMIVACFPKSKARGAIVLVPNKGLWWWMW